MYCATQYALKTSYMKNAVLFAITIVQNSPHLVNDFSGKSVPLSKKQVHVFQNWLFLLI